MRDKGLLAAAVTLACMPPGFAHHSFAPHFDASKPVSISGVITEYEQRNPHAYLHVAAEDENGLTREYVCESHGVTQLARNGIRPEMLAPGTRVTLTGSQARRNPLMCFFNDVTFADGRTLNVNGPRGAGPTVATAAAEAEPAAARTDIYGTWLLVPANRSTSGPQPMIEFLTPDGIAAMNAYDPFVDDPTFRCDPVAIRRAWFAPGTPLAISRDGEKIILRHEWMDVERIIHLDQADHSAAGERRSLGHSIGRFEGDTLVVHTANYAQGVLRQYVEMPGQPTRGLPNSESLVTVERLDFDPASNRLMLTIEHDDPAFYTRTFEPSTAVYAPSALELEPFGCQPENPDQTLRQPANRE